MEKFIDWLLHLEFYWYIIFAFLVFGLVMLILKYKQFRRLVFEFVLYAERYISGTKMGQERFKFVVTKVHQFIPLSLKPILTEKRIASIIEWAVRLMKKQLEKGLLNE